MMMTIVGWFFFFVGCIILGAVLAHKLGKKITRGGDDFRPHDYR